MIELFNEDCMSLMSRYPDGYFDLAIVDPPYGGGHHEQHNHKGTLPLRFGGRFDKYREIRAASAEDLTDTNSPEIKKKKKKTSRHKTISFDPAVYGGGITKRLRRQTGEYHEAAGHGRRNTDATLTHGTSPQPPNILTNYNGFQNAGLFGAETISGFRRHGILLSGGN